MTSPRDRVTRVIPTSSEANRLRDLQRIGAPSVSRSMRDRLRALGWYNESTGVTEAGKRAIRARQVSK